jgi:glutamate-1-semialdehyde 2,1-aminomutase
VSLAGPSGGLLDRIRARLLLSRAKHRSLQGHARIAQQLSRVLPFYEYDEDSFFATDGAPADVEARRRDGFARLSALFTRRAPKTLAASEELEAGMSDVAFVNAYRVPFQFRRLVRDRLRLGCVVAETDGPRVVDLDGNWSYDLGGSYGVNLFGSEFYKRCIERGVSRAGHLGLVLGSYHPVVVDNVRRLREISQLDEVSFHMSGTEAVMQAVRLARYHTGRSHVVRFSGAYHGWWDGVQAGVGNPRPPHELYTLKEMDDTTLRVLDTRNDIACVLVNPIQALHPNGAPASDSTLLAGDRKASYDKAAYTEWLRQLRDVCTRRGIVLVFDEVFLGFRLARGGVQEYFGVPADLVTYGKSLGGGLPVGVVCGKRAYMRRFRDDNPSDICLARGTFNSHPYVMATMNEFLRALDEPEIARTYDGLDARWNGRAEALNRALASDDLPVRVANLTSVMTTLYQVPSRYNWMFQYYLRAEGLALSWVGSGRFIFPHDTTDATFQAVTDRFVAAARAMQRDEFWWHPADLTNKSIKRRVLLELVSAGLARRASDPATPP